MNTVKSLKSWTIEDAEKAFADGFNVIGKDGKIVVTNDDEAVI